MRKLSGHASPSSGIIPSGRNQRAVPTANSSLGSPNPTDASDSISETPGCGMSAVAVAIAHLFFLTRRRLGTVFGGLVDLKPRG